MIESGELTKAVRSYRERCRTAQKAPTFTGFAAVIGVSGQTVANVAHGLFNGRRYTERPHASRVIDNADFETVQSLFNEGI